MTFVAMLLGDRVLRNPTTGIAGCCARAANGHATAAPASRAMNSRRLIASPKAQDNAPYWPKLAQLETRMGGVSSTLVVECLAMSALPLADICSAKGHVRCNPKSGHMAARRKRRQGPEAEPSFDQLIGPTEQRHRNS